MEGKKKKESGVLIRCGPLQFFLPSKPPLEQAGPTSQTQRLWLPSEVHCAVRGAAAHQTIPPL